MPKRICPECGRELETRTNRFGVEMWPQHKYGTWTDRSINYEDDRKREPGRHDNEVSCSNSAQPVL